MSDRKYKTVTRTQGNNQALKDGSVVPRGFAFDFEEVPVLIDAFRRMVRGNEFDICEMALSTYLCAREHGKQFTARPGRHRNRCHGSNPAGSSTARAGAPSASVSGSGKQIRV